MRDETVTATIYVYTLEKGGELVEEIYDVRELRTMYKLPMDVDGNYIGKFKHNGSIQIPKSLCGDVNVDYRNDKMTYITKDGGRTKALNKFLAYHDKACSRVQTMLDNKIIERDHVRKLLENESKDK